MTPVQRGAAAVALATGLIAGAEGLRLTAYLDPVTPTICYGETEGVRMGDTATLAECQAKLDRRVRVFAATVRRCAGADLPPPVEAAFTSLAYNIGGGAFCGSTLARKAKAGDLPGACAEISRWTYAYGVHVQGLANRRATERALCETALAGDPP